MSFLVCPYCQNLLVPTENKSFACELNHNFDLSKEGYLNLLPVNQKKSKAPGDNDMMIAARRAFLELGFYDPLIDGIINTIKHEVDIDKNNFTALDLGCGEGYYSEKALNNISANNIKIIGTDISKYAIKLAAKKYKNNFYFVSSVFNLPIANNSIDLLLSIFAPIEALEFKRVLAKNGHIIIVNPGKNHLKELAEVIYDNFKEHENNVDTKMLPAFKHQVTKQVSFKIDIKNNEQLLMLLKMTPYYWHTSKERLEKLTNYNSISITCDFNIIVYKHID
jgi:23S rRNA (guanine745-N1)-methyltransferase